MNTPRLVAKMKNDHRAWRASNIGDVRSSTLSLSDPCLSAIDQTIEELRRSPSPTTEIPIQNHCGACSEAFEPVINALESGPGFAIVDRLPLKRYSLREACVVYQILGSLIGCPFEQDVKGTLLFDVRDTGQDVGKGARFSVTSAESSFHTDNAFGEIIPDYVGLLCLCTAKAGGQSQLISAYSVHNELLEQHPDVLETLYRPFHFDRRGEFKKGEPPTSQTPIFHWDGKELTCRYLYYYIQVGHEKTLEPLTALQVKALTAMEELLGRQDLMVDFGLQPGQMLFTNNRWILHNRTAFEDFPELDRRRHYVRLWLRAKGR